MPLTAAQKRRIKRAIRSHYLHLTDPLAERLYIRDCFDKFSEGGQIAIVRKGHDCDHLHYYTVQIINTPPGVFSFCRAEDNHRQYLDGPEAMWLDPPSKHNNQSSYTYRDVAAEKANY